MSPMPSPLCPHPSATHHGRIYEYEMVGSGGQRQYRYIVVHDADPTHGGIGHVHVAQSRRGATYRLTPSENYSNIDDLFLNGEPIPFSQRYVDHEFSRKETIGCK